MATSQWARRRQTMYAGGIFLFLFFTITPYILITSYDKPTCFDGKKNQGEVSVDLGGPCTLLDESTVIPHTILWARTFEVRDGFYNAVAYIENPNQEAGVKDAVYQFKFYDAQNVIIGERFGRVSVPPGKVFPIFESRIDTGKRIPVRTFFSFVNDFAWEKMQDSARGITINNTRISNANTSPRIDADVRNNLFESRKNIVFIATIFDSNGNAIASSRTLVERLKADEKKTIAFTWPEGFSSDIARIDIVPLAIPK
ncbi:hypothetical protein COB52_01525 [Candidatus Kaiserbacteria bacterium]|nr:MAG: hypothetical protein COB52_01525 [Candidatus Kaiserbacteria bacterium]